MSLTHHCSLVTIFIPTIGRVNYLKSAITSAQQQTYQNLEILIGDNASRDGSRELIQAIAAEDSRISCYRFEHQVSMPENWQRGLDLARGEFFTLLGDDDILYPDFVETCLKPFLEIDNLQVSSGLHNIIDGDGNYQESLSIPRKNGYLQMGLGLQHIHLEKTFYTPPIASSLMKTQWAKSLSFKSYAGLAADADLFFRGAVKGFNVFCIERVVAEYRNHSNMLSATSEKVYADNLKSLDRIQQDNPQITSYSNWKALRELTIVIFIDALTRANKILEAKKHLTQYWNEINGIKKYKKIIKLWFLHLGNSYGRI